jgi:Ser/Thr protein kinase RdoA (MazF antagonist)
MKISDPNISSTDQLIIAVLRAYDIPADQYKLHSIDVGLINQTYLLQDQSGKEQHYILQNINANVFEHPEDIDHNIRLISEYLQQHYPQDKNLLLKFTIEKSTLLQINDRFIRVFDYISNTVTHNTVASASLAFEAAGAFARFSHHLKDFDVNSLRITIPDFHSLHYRSQQLEKAYGEANEERKKAAHSTLQKIAQQKRVIEFSINIPFEEGFVKRVMHHDTKISNVLFNREDKSVCVIDLDTVMPGYLFSDWGDMIRTYVCPVHESSQEFDAIHVRKDFLEAIFEGYIQGMPSVTALEKEHFITFGEIMILMQSIRFMTDYLNNDQYYPTEYAEQNLHRAINQITLLKALQEKN